MRTSINGQLQAVQSELERQTQQLFAQCEIASGAASPKLLALLRGSAFDRQQIETAAKKLTELDGLFGTLRQTNDELQLKFANELKAKAGAKIKPVGDDEREQQGRSDALSERVAAEIGKLAAEYNELDEICGKLPADGRLRARADELKPRIAALDSRAAAFTAAADGTLRSANAADEVQQMARGLRRDLEALERDWIPQLVSQGCADLSAEVQSASGEMEQRLANARMAAVQMDSAIAATTAQQDQTDGQLNELSKTLIDTGAALEDKGGEIGERLAGLEQALGALAGTIRGEISELAKTRESEREWYGNQFTEDISGLREICRSYLERRQGEWATFDRGNKQAGDVVRDGTESAEKAVGDANLAGRIEAAEKRVQWCRDRIGACTKEVQTGGTIEQVWARIAGLEASELALEQRIAAVDGGKGASEFEAFGAVEYKTEGAPPLAGEGADGVAAVELPEGIQLTYGPEGDVDDFPDSRSRAVREAPPAPKPESAAKKVEATAEKVDPPSKKVKTTPKKVEPAPKEPEPALKTVEASPEEEQPQANPPEPVVEERDIAPNSPKALGEEKIEGGEPPVDERPAEENETPEDGEKSQIAERNVGDAQPEDGGQATDPPPVVAGDDEQNAKGDNPPAEDAAAEDAAPDDAKEDAEDPPDGKEDPPDAKEGPPDAKEDPPGTKEDPPDAKEDPPDTKEDPPDTEKDKKEDEGADAEDGAKEEEDDKDDPDDDKEEEAEKEDPADDAEETDGGSAEEDES
jgi:hypothetical protein